MQRTWLCDFKSGLRWHGLEFGNKSDFAFRERMHRSSIASIAKRTTSDRRCADKEDELVRKGLIQEEIDDRVTVSHPEYGV